jgi:hypothetical protein
VAPSMPLGSPFHVYVLDTIRRIIGNAIDTATAPVTIGTRVVKFGRRDAAVVFGSLVAILALVLLLVRECNSARITLATPVPIPRRSMSDVIGEPVLIGGYLLLCILLASYLDNRANEQRAESYQRIAEVQDPFSQCVFSPR